MAPSYLPGPDTQAIVDAIQSQTAALDLRLRLLETGIAGQFTQHDRDLRVVVEQVNENFEELLRMVERLMETGDERIEEGDGNG
jgi:hypothetical protein